ncbi:acetylornithine transaminase [Dehalococcoides sp. THU3]|uniref:acetylornithine transaminase n=1 Tax=Dehalococcoides TaxID=61434 RepID=UPI0005B56B30|nr:MULTISPECIES: acetylornithine transaminase [Dehalococcoides]QYY57781.1 acetylornithine transaminase [Dehalococcoides mccartyi]BAQ34983.1 acetylornithine aminotransferase [Dehalococcoides sp. UCH007]
MDNWQELEHKYYMQTFYRAPITIVKGQGVKVWDDAGKEYLDFVAGWAVNSLGHCHPAVVKAVSEQAGILIQTSNNFYTIPQLKLAQLLVDNSVLDRIFFCNSGTEATEGAVKLARRYGKIKLKGAYEVITATGSFHGRTLAMVSASGQSKYQEPYTPLPTGFINVEYNNPHAIKAAITDKTCAVMLEPIQGESGVNVPDSGYLKAVRQICDETGILLILDEIQTGIGRTGKLFAYEHSGIEPDIITLAKGLASGVPIGAFMAKESASVFAKGEHGSTFGGNPLACAAGYATMKFILDNHISEHAGIMGSYLAKGFEKLKAKHRLIQGYRGCGLLMALGFNTDIAKEIEESCMEEGLLLNAVKPNALRFMPSLNITQADIDEALSKLERVLTRYENSGV